MTDELRKYIQARFPSWMGDYTLVAGQVIIRCPDGICANVWFDSRGEFQAVEV